MWVGLESGSGLTTLVRKGEVVRSRIFLKMLFATSISDSGSVARPSRLRTRGTACNGVRKGSCVGDNLPPSTFGHGVSQAMSSNKRRVACGNPALNSEIRTGHRGGPLIPVPSSHEANCSVHPAVWPQRDPIRSPKFPHTLWPILVPTYNPHPTPLSSPSKSFEGRN